MATPASHLLVLLSVTLAAASSAGCDDTSGTGGSGTMSSGTGTSGTTTGSSMSTGTGTTIPQWEAYCDAHAALSCSATFSAASCKSQQGCATGYLKDAIEAGLLECLSKDCNEDNCLAMTFSTPLSAEGAKFNTDCTANAKACMTSDDLCLAAGYLDDAHLAQLNGCLAAGDCAAKSACFKQFTDVLDTCTGWL
ncbi:MAG: hypothetical protein U0414_42605 [Polyangiaceae bacterium]